MFPFCAEPFHGYDRLCAELEDQVLLWAVGDASREVESVSGGNGGEDMSYS